MAGAEKMPLPKTCTVEGPRVLVMVASTAAVTTPMLWAPPKPNAQKGAGICVPPVPLFTAVTAPTPKLTKALNSWMG
jgi:hypothetical protein